MADIQQLQRRAERGSASAAYALACELIRNAGDSTGDIGAAERWLKIAGERGDRHALREFFERNLENDLPRAVRYGKRLVAMGPHNLARDVALQLVYGPTQDFDLDKLRTRRGPDPRRGVAWLRELARQDDLHAIRYLAIILDRSAPVRRKANEAFEWAKRAAQLGDTTPLVNLGAAAHNGENGRRNYKRSVACYRLAIRHRDATALLNLGRSYMAGHGVPRNPTKGVALIRKAIRLGEPAAELALAKILWDGEGVRQDREQAWSLASGRMRKGDLEAGAWCGCVLTEQEDDPLAQRRGVKLLERFVKRGSDAAMNDLAAYFHGLEPKHEYMPRTIQLYSRAISLGSTEAMENFARCLLDGHEGFLPRNPSAAIYLLKRASALGDGDARKLLREVLRRQPAN
jgi:uncharacterized protein